MATPALYLEPGLRLGMGGLCDIHLRSSRKEAEFLKREQMLMFKGVYDSVIYSDHKKEETTELSPDRSTADEVLAISKDEILCSH